MEAYDRKFWGKVPPSERTLWGRWLRRQRGDRTQADVVEALGLAGRPLKVNTYSEMEGRDGVNDDWRAVFRRLYGKPEGWEPEPDEWSPRTADDATSPDLAALVARLDRQAEVIDRLAAAVELLAKGQDELLKGFLEGLADLRRAPAADPASASHAGTP